MVRTGGRSRGPAVSRSGEASAMYLDNDHHCSAGCENRLQNAGLQKSWSMHTKDSTFGSRAEEPIQNSHASRRPQSCANDSSGLSK